MPASALVCVCGIAGGLRHRCAAARSAAPLQPARGCVPHGSTVMIDCSCCFAAERYCSESSSCWKPEESTISETSDCWGCSYWLTSSAEASARTGVRQHAAADAARCRRSCATASLGRRRALPCRLASRSRASASRDCTSWIWPASDSTSLLSVADRGRRGSARAAWCCSAATSLLPSLFCSCVTLSPVALPVSAGTTHARPRARQWPIRHRCLRFGAVIGPVSAASRSMAGTDRARLAMRCLC